MGYISYGHILWIFSHVLDLKQTKKKTQNEM
jgi:hypothetical protein